MFRRCLPLAPLAPAVAIIAFAAAGAAAQSLARNKIEDVQVGEAGNLTRIALICRDDCRVGARSSGVFYLPGVASSLDVDLSSRSAHVSELLFEPADGGSTMTIRADTSILRASIKRCEIDASPASCIDLEFGNGEPVKTARATPPAEVADKAPALVPPPLQPAQKEAASDPVAEVIAANTPAPVAAPALRETPEGESLIFARFAPPERLPPPTAPKAASFTKEAAPVARRPIILTDRAAPLLGGDIDIGAMATEILGRNYGVAECGGAQARLRADAWALDAMVDVGFCNAIDGKLEEADGAFIRLLAYTPDNYEALVGRALIAAKAGEKGVARKYFQDALNALPPIVESDRIVEAMARL